MTVPCAKIEGDKTSGGTHNDVSWTDCLNLCCRQASASGNQVCKSFDFYPATGSEQSKCELNKKKASEVNSNNYKTSPTCVPGSGSYNELGEQIL